MTQKAFVIFLIKLLYKQGAHLSGIPGKVRDFFGLEMSGKFACFGKK